MLGILLILPAFAGCAKESPAPLEAMLANASNVELNATIIVDGKTTMTKDVSVPAGKMAAIPLAVSREGGYNVKVTWKEGTHTTTIQQSQRIDFADPDCSSHSVVIVNFPVHGTSGAIAAGDATDNCK